MNAPVKRDEQKSLLEAMRNAIFSCNQSCAQLANSEKGNDAEEKSSETSDECSNWAKHVQVFARD
jgi:hypothetical protein